MSIFAKLKRRNAVARLIDEQMYEIVVEELQSGIRRNGLWAKALAKSEGDESKAKAFYISYRVQSLKDESEINEEIKEYEAKGFYDKSTKNSSNLQEKIRNFRDEGYSFYIIAEEFNRESVNIPSEFIEYFNKWSPELVEIINKNG